MPPKDQAHLQQLIQQCLNGHEKARRELYDLFASGMYAICLRYSKDENAAKDVFQDGFIRVYRYLKDYKGAGSFEGWMKRIFVNTSLEHLRKNNKWLFTSEPGEDLLSDGVQPSAYEHLAYQDLIRLISALPDGYRTVFNLFVIEGYSHKEIAEMLNISESTSKTQLFKARRQLQEQIKHLYKS
jgi:RNA polymerase sigma-70 factor (ECF subfamily)